MKSYPLYILPSGSKCNPNPAYLNDLPWLAQVIPIDSPSGIRPTGDIYGFLYDNEYFDDKLLAALPDYFENKIHWDVLVLFKKVGEKVFTVPRFFGGNIHMKPDQLVPAMEGIEYLRVLDGWVL